MLFGLEFLEEFIQDEISTKHETQTQLTEQQAREKHVILNAEVEKIKKSLLGFMIQTSSENQIENSIQVFQTHLVNLADVVMRCRESVSEDLGPYHRVLCISVYSFIDDLIKYIERYFSKYFNQDELVPLAYLWMAKNEVSNSLAQVERLISNAQVDEELLKIALYPVREFVKENERRFTYRRLIYIRQLISDLRSKLEGPCTTSTILDQLCYLNYNSFHFLTYVTEKISTEVKEQTTLADQIETLSFWVKRFNQRQVKPDFALKRDRPSLQEQVNIWLQEEISFAEKKKQITFMFSPSAQAPKADAFKIVTSLSVPQLAFVVKILKEAGVIKNSNQTDVIRFFAKNFSTEKIKNISPESLRIKYYSAESSAVRSVRDVLNKLLSHTKDN